MENTKKVLIADSSEEFSAILSEAISKEEDLEVVGRTGDGQDAIRRHLSVQDVVTLAAFFLRKYAELIVFSLTSCKRELRRTKDPKAKADLEAKLELEAKVADKMLRQLVDSLIVGAG